MTLSSAEIHALGCGNYTREVLIKLYCLKFDDYRRLEEHGSFSKFLYNVLRVGYATSSAMAMKRTQEWAADEVFRMTPTTVSTSGEERGEVNTDIQQVVDEENDEDNKTLVGDNPSRGESNDEAGPKFHGNDLIAL
ncbi:hypothetical protein F66182_6438 [Fusarium sp. NRRL 66182]|nr:hypothetical protein F66182_6438 [Fusarium sp. NRRL 66182]